MRCHSVAMAIVNQSECVRPYNLLLPLILHIHIQPETDQVEREREEDYWSEFGHVWTPSRLSHAPIVQDEAGLRVELFLLRPPGLR